VVRNVTTAKGTAGNSFYGLAIGLTVMPGAFAVGSISGGAFNRAAALSATLMGLSTWSNIWIFWVAELVAGAPAAVGFQNRESGRLIRRISRSRCCKILAPTIAWRCS